MPAVFFVQQSLPDWSGSLKGNLICHDKKGHWSCRLDLNQRPADYKSAALPTELRQRVAGLSRLSGKQVRYVLFYIGEKRNQCVFGAKRVPCPLRSPFGHYQYSTHFRKNRPVFFPTSRYVSTSPYSASVKRRNAFSFRRYTSDFSTCNSSQSRSACPLRLFT